MNTSAETAQNRKGKKTLSNLALDLLEPIVEDNVQDRRVRIEDAPEDDDDLEFLDEQEVEVECKKGKNKRTTKRNKK